MSKKKGKTQTRAAFYAVLVHPAQEQAVLDFMCNPKRKKLRGRIDLAPTDLWAQGAVARARYLAEQLVYRVVPVAFRDRIVWHTRYPTRKRPGFVRWRYRLQRKG